MNNEGPPPILKSAERAEWEEEFKPVKQNRQGELFAWICAFGIFVAILILTWSFGAVTFWIYALFLFFILAGISISFSNFLDARTMIHTSKQGLRYHSPLRRVYLDWVNVRRLIAIPSGRGWRIRVEGEYRFFQFRAPSKVKVGKRGEMELGFTNGDRLVSLIRGSAQLDQIEEDRGAWIVRSSVSVEPNLLTE